MKFICDKILLSNAIDGVSKAVTNRSAIPVLEGILLKAEGFQLTLTGYDMEIGITTTIESNVLVPGETVLNAKQLGDIIHRMPAGEVELELSNNGTVTIKGGVAEFEIPAMMAGDYPSLPNPGADHTTTMPCAKLADMLNKTLYAVSQDGYRLAIVSREVECTRDIRIIIPGKTLQELLKLMGDDENDTVTIDANRRYAVFHTKQYTIMSRLIEGDFLNYESVIPQGASTTATIECRDFIDTIERASLIITERLKNPLRITFNQAENKVLVRCQTNLGRVQDEFDAKIDGNTVEIGFNNRYLLDALRNSKAERVTFQMNGALSPIKILPEEGDDFTYLVLPVRFKND